MGVIVKGHKQAGKVGLLLAMAVGVGVTFCLGFACALLLSRDSEPPSVAVVSQDGHGLSQTDWRFLRQFDKPLAQDSDNTMSGDEIRRRIKADLERDYQIKKSVIAERYPDLREPELFVSYLALRVAFSLPVLDSGLYLQRDLRSVLLSPRGNCLHHAMRASILFDTFGIPARIAYFSTAPYIMGHAVADVYVPEHRLAALVDTTKKFIFFIRDADASFFETLLAIRDKDARAALMDKVVVVAFPPDVRYFNPSDAHLASWVSEKNPPIVLTQVRERLARNRLKNTRAAFIDGYDRMLTQKGHPNPIWWLRIKNLADFEPIIEGLKSWVNVDNTRIHEIIADDRNELIARKHAQKD